MNNSMEILVQGGIQFLKKLQEKEMKIIDWDDVEVEIQYPNGDRRWVTEIELAQEMYS